MTPVAAAESAVSPGPTAPPTRSTDRSLTTPTAPELADVSAQALRRHLREDSIRAILLLLAEAFFTVDLTRDVLARILGADLEDYAWGPAIFIALAVMTAAFFTAGWAGEASRHSALAMWIWLGIVATLGGGLFYARITHSAATGVTRASSGPGATPVTHDAQNLILALLLLAIYLATSALAFHSGRTWRHPVLRQMVTAKTARDALIKDYESETAMLQGLRSDLGATEVAIANLNEERDTAIREATEMVYAASAVSLQRLVERLGRPDAAGITRHRPDFGPLPYGLDRVPPPSGDDEWLPTDSEGWKKADRADE